MADVSIVVHMCGLFHQRYAEFAGSFINELLKMFKNYNCKEEEKVGWILKVDSDLMYKNKIEIILCMAKKVGKISIVYVALVANRRTDRQENNQQ